LFIRSEEQTPFDGTAGLCTWYLFVGADSIINLSSAVQIKKVDYIRF